MSKLFTITPIVSGFYATTNISGETDKLNTAAAELRNYTNETTYNRLGYTSSRGYAIRCDYPDTEEVRHLTDLPVGAAIESVFIGITLTAVGTAKNSGFFYGPLHGDLTTGARIKTGKNNYKGFASGTRKEKFDAHLAKWLADDGRSLIGTGFGLGGNYRTSAYQYDLSNVFIEITTNEETHDLTITAGTGGTVTPSGTVSVDSFNTLTVKAIPNTGYSFSHWELVGGGSISSAYSAETVFTGGTADAQLTAVFEEGQYGSLNYVGIGEKKTAQIYYNNGTNLSGAQLFFSNGTNLIRVI